MRLKIATIVLLAALPSVYAQSLDFTKCSSTSECLNTCECVPDVSICVNKAVAVTLLSKCTPCRGNEDCPNDVCETLTGMCAKCVITGMNAATKSCIPPKAATQKETDVVSETTGPVIEFTPVPVEGKPVQVPSTEVSHEIETTETSDGTSISVVGDDEMAESSPEPKKCVSTAFLRKHNLLDEAIVHGGSAKVLCIPGLPCGTSGHLIRKCNFQGLCDLVSYKEVCENRVDCVESRMQVSQLSHKYDWSKFQIKSDDTTFSLTSLSVDPESRSTYFSFSRCVAIMTDFMIQYGMSSVCDVVAGSPILAKRIVRIARMTSSSWSN